MPRRGRRRKKNRTHVVENQESAQNALSTTKEENKIPKSLVIRRGKTEHEVGELVEDLRKLMLPYTALHFQEDPKNRKLTLAKYCQELALPMGITHILAFSQNEQRLNMRLARTPEGPTITFRVAEFSLSKHIKALQRRPVSDKARALHQNPPIVVTNNFGDSTAPPHIKLLRITFQNMFPAINVATVKLTECRRVVLFHLVEEEVQELVPDEDEEDNDDNDDDDNNDDKEDGDSDDSDKQKEKKRKEKQSTSSSTSTDSKNDKHSKKTAPPKMRTVTKQRVHIRHYAIKATPVGVNRKVRRLIQAKVPNLNRVQDIADYITGQASHGAASVGDASDSEAEEDPNHVVQLAQSYAGKGNHKQQRSALKLVEMGPRLSLELLKVEKGLGGGEVLHHAHIHKSAEEAKDLKERKERERSIKQQRKEEQERNVERKRQGAEEKRETKRRRKEEREQQAMEALRQGGGTTNSGEMVDSDNDDNDEAENDEKVDQQNDESSGSDNDDDDDDDDDDNDDDSAE